jgi:hypothetical protein
LPLAVLCPFSDEPVQSSFQFRALQLLVLRICSPVPLEQFYLWWGLGLLDLGLLDQCRPGTILDPVLQSRHYDRLIVLSYTGNQ